MKKQEGDQFVIDHLRDWIEEQGSDGVLYVSASSEVDTSVGLIRGNMHTIIQGLASLMNTNELFNDFFMAAIGIYLSKNPEQKAKFMQGLTALEINDRMNDPTNLN